MFIFKSSYFLLISARCSMCYCCYKNNRKYHACYIPPAIHVRCDRCSTLQGKKVLEVIIQTLSDDASEIDSDEII